MPLPAPAHCRPEAYELFTASVPRIETDYGLLMAALAISMHELDDVDPAQIDGALQSMADTVRSRVTNGSESAWLAHAHAFLFDELKLRGNRADYYDPANSYLPVVLRTGTGLPIALCLIYKIVLERIGLHVDGIAAPGHFLSSVAVRGRRLLVDPFDGGRVVSEDEASERVARAIGRVVPARDALPVASHRDWIRRMLRNLHAVFSRRDRPDDLGAMVELSRLL